MVKLNSLYNLFKNIIVFVLILGLIYFLYSRDTIERYENQGDCVMCCQGAPGVSMDQVYNQLCHEGTNQNHEPVWGCINPDVNHHAVQYCENLEPQEKVLKCHMSSDEHIPTLIEIVKDKDRLERYGFPSDSAETISNIFQNHSIPDDLQMRCNFRSHDADGELFADIIIDPGLLQTHLRIDNIHAQRVLEALPTPPGECTAITGFCDSFNDEKSCGEGGVMFENSWPCEYIGDKCVMKQDACPSSASDCHSMPGCGLAPPSPFNSAMFKVSVDTTDFST